MAVRFALCVLIVLAATIATAADPLRLPPVSHSLLLAPGSETLFDPTAGLSVELAAQSGFAAHGDEFFNTSFSRAELFEALASLVCADRASISP